MATRGRILRFFPETFANGYVVGHSVQKGRNRDSFYKYMCVYDDPSYVSFTSAVPYVGVTWVSISRWTSSHLSTTSLSLC